MNELYHHGVKGRKWGVNRYQDKTKQLIAKRKAIAEKKGVNAYNKGVTFARKYMR